MSRADDKSKDQALAREMAELTRKVQAWESSAKGKKAKERELLNQTRKAAAVPFESYCISPGRANAKLVSRRDADGKRVMECTDPSLVWTLEWSGKRVSQWREEHAPGLGNWIRLRMQQLHGNWHVARAPLKVLPAQRQSAKDTAEKKKGKGPARAAVVAEIARLNSKGRKPKLSIPDIAAKADCTETYVRRIINGK